MKSYIAFFGGLVLAVWTMSLWPHLSKRLVNFPPGRVFPVVFVSYFLLLLLSVWVVAFNFVPGGVLTRERSDVMFVITILLIGMASRKIGSDESSKVVPRQKAVNKKSTLLGRFFRRLSTISEEESEEWQETTKGSATHQVRARELIMAEEKEGRQFHSKAIKGATQYSTVQYSTQHMCTLFAVGVVIVLLALFGFASRYRPNPPMPVKVPPISCVYMFECATLYMWYRRSTLML